MELFIYIVIIISICWASRSFFGSLLKKSIDFNISTEYLAFVSQAVKACFLTLCLFTSINQSAIAQTTGTTYKSGVNGGNPPTNHSPITEIIDFVDYDDLLASSLSGQAFEIKLISGHILKFTLKKTGSPFSAFPAKTNPKASMGRVAYIPPAPNILPVLYSTTKPCIANITMEDISVFQPDGVTQSSSWNIIIIDSETTNLATETITTTTNGQNWTEWDLITNISSNPIQSGIGSPVVNWTGTVNGETGAYAIASIKPTIINSILQGAKQGISIGVQTYDSDFEVQTCSGYTFNLNLQTSSGATFTWSEPVIDHPETLTGGTSQNTAAAGSNQTLINNSETPAIATYVVTPQDGSGTDLAPFTVRVTVNPMPKASILYPGSYCTIGLAEVIQTGQTGGTYLSDSGLSINPHTGAIDLSASTPGKHIITYVFDNGSCSDSVTTEVDVNQQPTVLITDPAAICGPGSIDLESTVITLGSTPGLIFSYWKDENATIPLSNPSAVSADGVYYIKGTTGTGCSEIKPVKITINSCSPVAADDTYVATEDTPINIDAPGILLNDSDPNNDPLTAILVNAAKNGKLIIKPDGSFTYAPNPGFHGTDQFTYKVSDGNLESNIATVTIIVSPVNDPPLATDDTYGTTEDTPIAIAAPGILLNDSDPDGDTFTALLITGPVTGKLIINPDGSFIYTPNIKFHGTDTFKYKVSDGSLESNIATVTITVTSVNGSPVAADDHYELVNNDLEGRVNLNDYDPDGDSLIYGIITNPEHGDIQINPDGTFRYTPEPGYSGMDFFVYKVCDSEGLCAEAKVFLTTQPGVVVSLTPSKSKIAEGSKVTITAVLSRAFPEDVRVTLNYSGDAQNGKDYTLFENFVTINIPAGQTTATEYFVLAALIDDLNEKEEQVLISISEVNSDRVKIGSGAQVSIIDLYPPSKEITEEPGNPDIKPDPLISPNGDGQGNERFLIDKIDQYPDNLVLIFNRWGNEVFRINSYNNNENSFHGIANTGILTNTNKDLPEGVYYYLIHTTDSDNKKRLNKGYLILKR